MKILLLLLNVILGVVLLTGCQTGTKTDPLVSVTITNQPESAIAHAVDAVFVSHGYSGGRIGPGQYAYHRTATSGSNLLADDHQFDTIVTLRVIVIITPIDARSTLVSCDPSAVEGADDFTFGSSRTVHKVRTAPYAQMLKDVRAQFGQ